MSIGPSALGTVLVQRLDAVLGTTMAAHANLVSGARPDAVAQPGEAVRPGQAEHAGRSPRQPLDPAARGQRDATVANSKDAEASGQPARSQVTRTDATASAPTTLGQTARTILALLAQYPDRPPPARGQAPLWPGPTSPAEGAAPPRVADGHAPLPGDAPARGAAGLAAARPDAAGNAPMPGARPGHPVAGVAAPAMTGLRLPAAATLAAALRHALQNSGLFYESHLSDLAYGQRTADQLRAQPQALLPRAALPPHESAGRPPLPAQGATPGDAPASTQAPSPGPTGIHPEAAPLVRQQLDILANQTLVWQGQAWPGTPLEWEVRRDRHGEADEAGTHWATRLTLDLPRLGQVQARLTLANDQLVLQLLAPRSAREINAAAQALRANLQRAGLTLTHLSVDAVAAHTPQATP